MEKRIIEKIVEIKRIIKYHAGEKSPYRYEIGVYVDSEIRYGTPEMKQALLDEFHIRNGGNNYYYAYLKDGKEGQII